jgi:hypothetical protein
METEYGESFRDAYALLHGGRGDEYADIASRGAGEPLEDYLARTRVEVLGAMRKRMLARQPPEGLSDAHTLLIDLLSNAVQADEALAEQVKAYQCGQFHESIRHSDRLQELVIESQRLDRELIVKLKMLQPELLDELGIEALEEDA